MPVAAQATADRPKAAGGRRLTVPAELAERERLRDLACAYARERQLVAPLSLEDLRRHARAVLERGRAPATSCDFVMVLLNNEVWRDLVAAVPFARRTLLLPPCLRSSEHCPAEFDEFGLICERCGRCVLAELSREAEALGYAVLIAEGTSIVAGLIEQGMIDAVVGVSCMVSLEKTFPHISAGAIPGLAVPLLRDGCKDTDVDVAWVREAIHLRATEGRFRLPDLNALHGEVSSWFDERYLRQRLRLTGTKTEEIAVSWLAKAGKRWRPFLAVSVYRALAGDGDLPEKVKAVAVAVECIHKASLIYDDIQDGDDCRYGEETVYRRHGVPVALTASLFLLGQGYRLLADCAAREDERCRMLSLATRGHCELCLGQGRELCWMDEPRPLTPDEVLDIFMFKTAPSFEVVFRLGAICAGLDDALEPVLVEYSRQLGVAYQVQDDLHDFRQGGDVDDVKAGRPSIVLALALEQARGEAAESIAAAWCGREGAAGPEELRDLIRRTDAESRASEVALACKRKALAALSPLRDPRLKILLHRVAARILRDL